MARLIDAEALKEKMTVSALGGRMRIWVCGVIDDAPTVEPQSAWIKCSERMPDTHGFYLTYMESLDRFSVLLWTGKDDPINPEAWNRVGACADCITHWMPITEPKEEEE